MLKLKLSDMLKHIFMLLCTVLYVLLFLVILLTDGPMVLYGGAYFKLEMFPVHTSNLLFGTIIMKP